MLINADKYFAEFNQMHIQPRSSLYNSLVDVITMIWFMKGVNGSHANDTNEHGNKVFHLSKTEKDKDRNEHVLVTHMIHMLKTEMIF
jgi:hypothetical protein